ncbi:hypothetical protein ACLOJK_020413 [Asimina triloba]
MAAAADAGRKRACVTGASGYVGAMLVKCLLDDGYDVNATVRDPADNKKVGCLLDLRGLGDLKLFKADLSEDGSFDEAINGCDFVFHVATPVAFKSEDPENDMIKPSIKGVLNVLKSCAKLKTVKRVVYTSSVSAVLDQHQIVGNDLVLDEENWSDVEYLTSKKPFTWGYAVSKTLAEKKAFEFAKENNLDVVSINPVVIAGPSVKQEVGLNSIGFALALLTGNERMIEWMKIMQLESGGISLVHLIDVCRAHIFVAEKESAFGRYICSALDTTAPELAKFLAQRYPRHSVSSTRSFDDLPEKPRVRISSQKLIKAGFTYNYGIEEIYDDSSSWRTLVIQDARGVVPYEVMLLVERRPPGGRRPKTLGMKRLRRLAAQVNFSRGTSVTQDVGGVMP